MAGKKEKDNTKSASKKGNEHLVGEERLQAVVLTDSFETRFMPLTAVKPRCLLPLANTPLIEYTLEFLAKAGVNEVYLVCASHADQINEYIEKSKWNLPWAPFKLQTIMSLESRSVGDAMRDIDNRGLITGDFILVSGDLVTNMQFDKALEFHRKKRASDKDHIVTMCLSEGSQFYRTRSHDPAAFILDKKTNRCLYYHQLPPASSRKKGAIDIDPELLEDVDDFVLRNDLIDCHVDICSALVPAIFQENFDYQFLRSDFVKGVLTSDLLKKSIYAYIMESYAARVESWQTYDAISQDFIARWCYPLVLNANFLEDQTYSYESRHVYKEKNVVLAQSCKIGKHTAIGSGTKIGEGTSVENSVIGRNCHIGDNVVIQNSYIWDDTTVLDSTIIEHSILASNVKIGRNVSLSDGCVIGFNVIIGDNMVIPQGCKISETPVMKSEVQFLDNESYDEDDSTISSDRATNFKLEPASDLLGETGVGYIYESDGSNGDEDASDETRINNTLAYRIDELYLSDDSISSSTGERKKKRTMSTTSVYTDMEGEDEEDEEDFEVEAMATVERAMENSHDLDTALLELNTLRMSMNVTYHEVRAATVFALLKRVYHFIATQTLGAKEAISKIFGKWGLLFNRQAFEKDEYIDLMNILLEKVLVIQFEKPEFVLFRALNCLYDQDVLDEEIIYTWWAQVSDDAKYDQVKTLTAKWIEWLQTAEEESSEEEESGEEESEDD
ncbi:LAMI_0H19284g1_1 [Lachancea mirantina]|uniref:Translation initiation factor eIF2B subunit epsilon n=1 Tax=Lachancea mirantina TaxID=1230905 RepID=A0A1G4KJV9_9SACH|nr:LAMI_0H19284g1_1 [Lachancea mirantina]